MDVYKKAQMARDSEDAAKSTRYETEWAKKKKHREDLDRSVDRLAEILKEGGFEVEVEQTWRGALGNLRSFNLTISGDGRRDTEFLTSCDGSRVSLFKTPHGGPLLDKPATVGTWLKSFSSEARLLVYSNPFPEKVYDMNSERAIRKLAEAIVSNFATHAYPHKRHEFCL